MPGFLVRQFYLKGSLRNEEGGFRLEARNPMGDGMLVGIGRFSVDGDPIDRADVSAIRDGDAEWTIGAAVSRMSPVLFRKGDHVTFHVADRTLSQGKHKLELEIIERDAGSLSLSLEDEIS